MGPTTGVLLASGPLPDDGKIPGSTSVWYRDQA
jgi:hypothetical protein